MPPHSRNPEPLPPDDDTAAADDYPEWLTSPHDSLEEQVRKAHDYFEKMAAEEDAKEAAARRGLN